MGDTSAADMELEQLEEEDIMDFLQSKGTALDAFRKEFTELQKVCRRNWKAYVNILLLWN